LTQADSKTAEKIKNELIKNNISADIDNSEKMEEQISQNLVCLEIR